MKHLLLFLALTSIACAQGGPINSGCVSTDVNGNIKNGCTASAAGLTGWEDVVLQDGIDNTGVTDVSTALTTLMNGLGSANQHTLYFGPGTYKINNGILISATQFTKGGIRIVGAGRDSTIFTSTCVNGYALWYNNTTNSGDGFTGMQISDMQFQDVSASNNACNDVIRFTQTALNIVERVKVLNARGNTYSTGTVGISGATVTGSGTTWTAAMVPGIIQVNGVYQEVCTFVSATSLTLCSTAWSKGTVSSGASYALAYGGRALTFDPGFSYTQYITIHDLFALNNMFCIYSMGTVGSANGNSRISVDGKAGWCGDSGIRIPNSVGIWLGKKSDTFEIHTPVNNKTRCFALESAHANALSNVECENNGTPAVVTTCNGGVASQTCLIGIESNADGTGTGYGNSYTNPYVYSTGTAIVSDNVNGAYNLTITGLRSASFSNTNSYSFNGVLGCPGNTSGIPATILDWDCVHLQVTQTVGLIAGRRRSNDKIIRKPDIPNFPK